MARRRITPTQRTSSSSTAPWPSARQILASGRPFVPFSTFSILDWHASSTSDSTAAAGSTNQSPFSQWLRDKLQEGRPIMVTDFHKLEEWDQGIFNLRSLIELSTDKAVYIRSCGNGRGQTCTLTNFVAAMQSDANGVPNLYARDLPCPQRWMELCNKVIPTELQWGGSMDLFQWLPQHARSEVMMAYIGSRGSYSGFHRCFGATVALNLLVEANDNVLCFGTDHASQAKYDSFMDSRGISSHTDWANLTPEVLESADFPIYVQEQKVGDLVIFPPATAHQVCNAARTSTKLVWNILHPLSVEVGFNYVQPCYNRLCHPDIARTNLSLACAVLSLTSRDCLRSLPPELPLLVRLFRQLVEDETIVGQPVTQVKLVCLPFASVAECNFCGTAIWNRHVHCVQCKDFDVCLTCFVGGRSCDHTAGYEWAEIVPVETWKLALTRANEALGTIEESSWRSSDEERSLATCVNDQLKFRSSGKSRLCHLCRIEHPEWKGRPCERCSAFFCFRGLYRHFDLLPLKVAKFANSWTCPKCREICNCRCCHFKIPYSARPKPPKKQRVASIDSRGKTMGFMDNVFDQKRQSENLGVLSKGNKRANSRPILPTTSMETHKRSPSPSMDVIGRNIRQRAHLPPKDLQLPPFAPTELDTDILKAQTVRSLTLDSSLSKPKTMPESRTSVEGSVSKESLNGTNGVTHSPRWHQLISLPYSNSQSVASSAEWLRQSAPSVESESSRSEPLASESDRTVTQLEQQIARLRRYADELFELSLHESRAKLVEQLSDLETLLKKKKADKSNELINKLETDFPALAKITKREMEQLGYLG